MLKNRNISRLYICRKCLNTYSKMPFNNYELKYKYNNYYFECSKCGNMRHIVKSVKLLYAWKLFFVKNPDDLIKPEEQKIEKAMRRKNRIKKIKRWFNM